MSINTTADKHFNQIAFESLYGEDSYRCIRGQIHKWVGTHWEEIEDGAEMSRIAEFCDNFAEQVSKNQRKHTKATAKSAEGVLSWAKTVLYTDLKLVDPPGLNLSNGVLQFEIDEVSRQVKTVLLPHSKELYYTYVSEAVFDENADRTQALNLMKCLDDDQAEILLRVLAASFDLETVRKLHGDRCVRSMLAYGEGENGKDTLRVVMQKILGHGVTGVPIVSFKTYDQGKKFPVAPLERSRLNWSSENSGNIVIDEVQSLKQAITGDTLACERKNKDEYDFEPKSVFIFNVNKLPTIVGSLHAIRSRYGILSFNKQFTLNPAKPNEIKADPRFKRDPEFIKNEVLPGFLSLLMDAFKSLIAEGIDYTAIDETFDETRKKSSHLHTFCEDVGLIEAEGEQMSVKEIWEMLTKWYLSEGLAHESTDGTIRFHKMEHWSDEAVSCKAHLFKRLQQIFPDIQHKRTNTERKIIGLKIGSKDEVKTVPATEVNPEVQDYQAGMPIETQIDDGSWQNGSRVDFVEAGYVSYSNPATGETGYDFVGSPYIRPCREPMKLGKVPTFEHLQSVSYRVNDGIKRASSPAGKSVNGLCNGFSLDPTGALQTSVVLRDGSENMEPAYLWVRR